MAAAKGHFTMSMAPAGESRETGVSGPAPELSDQEIEAQVLQRLAEVGLVVPTRDPNRPHTKTEQRCEQGGAVGFPVGGGKSFFYRPRCKSKGCPRGCAELLVAWEMVRISHCHPGFVGIEDVHRNSPAYVTNADKIPHDALWVTSVATPPEDPRLVKERVNKRVERLVRSGLKVECVLVPCDGATIIVSTVELADQKVRGRKQLAPTSGWWCPPGVALLVLSRTLASTAVNGRIWWTKGWKPVKPPKRAHVVSGSALIAKTACRILQSENYEFSGPSWAAMWEDDPHEVLHDAKDSAERFWLDPRCTICDAEIGPQEDYWWRAGEALCGVCDLAQALASILTCPLTERDIEARLHFRKLTFKRRRTLIEKALGRAGAEKLLSGMWTLKSAGEDVA
jgi:hypothetical protein